MAQAALPPAARLPLLGLAVLALVSGVVAGLARLGLNVPDFGPPLAAMHGALLVAAFFAAVISLERAVALGAAPAYLAPAAAGLGGLSLIARAPGALAQALCATAALLLLLESLLIWQRQRTLHTATLAFGAGALCAGDLVWALAGATAAVPWWFAFLLLTIAGERLELTRLLPAAPGSKRAFTAILALLLAGAAVAGAGLGWLPYAAALALFALWLLRHDIARRTVRQAGLTRYIAVCLLAGYFWL
ncbi:MAG: hypothetical protein JNJ60_00720, partial [Rhodocyclaceae bacterium]|nr:hypothetical protein [Rhodocyclaceae bacterium]